MTVTERVLEQGKALVRAIEALETIEATGPIEQVQVWFLLQAYRRRLRGIVEVAPEWVGEEMLSAGERVGAQPTRDAGQVAGAMRAGQGGRFALRGS